MGKNARLRKEQDEREQAMAKLEIATRRAEKIKDTKRLLTRSFITLGLTLLVLYVGWRVNGDLPSWVSKMKGATP